METGRWANQRPEPVDVPACFGYEEGIWYQVTEGMRGVVVADEAGKPHAYLLTIAATHYYEIMARHPRMLVLIGQTI